MKAFVATCEIRNNKPDIFFTLKNKTVILKAKCPIIIIQQITPSKLLYLMYKSQSNHITAVFVYGTHCRYEARSKNIIITKA